LLEKLKKRTHPTVAEPVEAVEAVRPPVEVQVLDVRRTYRTEDRQAEHLRVAYTEGVLAKELTVSVPWESMALLRAELARARYAVSDNDILDRIVVPWAIDQIATAPEDRPIGEILRLELDGGPRPLAISEMLYRYGFPSREPQRPIEGDRPWLWEG
jgi:hypothetical protein